MNKDVNPKIVFLISTLGGGGAERVCTVLANSMVEHNWQVSVVTFQDTNSSANILNEKVKHTCLHVTRARYSAFALRSHLKKLQPSIVVAFNNEVLIAEWLCSCLWARNYQLIYRSVTAPSGIVFHSGGGFISSLRFRIISMAVSKANLVISQCEMMEQDVRKSFGIPAEKSQYIYNPIDAAENIVLPIETAGSPYLLIIGRLDFNKDQATAIQAFSVLKKRGYEDIRLVIAGDGPTRDELERLTQNLGVSDYVDFLGYVSDVDSLYLSAHAVLLTSHYEGFPNVLVEAIGFGVPILSFDILSGPSEIIIDGVNGLLVKNRSVGALANALQICLDAKWDAIEIRATARRFDLVDVLSVWEDQFNKILSGYHSR